MQDNSLHGTDRSQCISIPVNDGRSNKEITQVFYFGEYVIVLNVDVNCVWGLFILMF